MFYCRSIGREPIFCFAHHKHLPYVRWSNPVTPPPPMGIWKCIVFRRYGKWKKDKTVTYIGEKKVLHVQNSITKRLREGDPNIYLEIALTFAIYMGIFHHQIQICIFYSINAFACPGFSSFYDSILNPRYLK